MEEKLVLLFYRLKKTRAPLKPVASHILEGVQPSVLWVFRPQPGKRQESTVASLFVDSFIPRCHVIT